MKICDMFFLFMRSPLKLQSLLRTARYSYPVSKILISHKTNDNKASQAIQSPRTVPFFLLVSLLDEYSFPNVLVKGIVAFKH